MVSLLIYNRSHKVLAIAVIHHIFCNKWEINPEYENVLI
jgi:hypothetical protein